MGLVRAVVGQQLGVLDGCAVYETYDYPEGILYIKKVCIETILIMIANVQQTDHSTHHSVQHVVHDDFALDSISGSCHDLKW